MCGVTLLTNLRFLRLLSNKRCNHIQTHVHKDENFSKILGGVFGVYSLRRCDLSVAYRGEGLGSAERLTQIYDLNVAIRVLSAQLLITASSLA